MKVLCRYLTVGIFIIVLFVVFYQELNKEEIKKMSFKLNFTNFTKIYWNKMKITVQPCIQC